MAASLTDRGPLLATLGVSLNPAVLEHALTHRSFAYENGGIPHNERLEFLGDSVLGLSVKSLTVTALPRMASPRNSSRSLCGMPPCSYAYER